MVAALPPAKEIWLGIEIYLHHAYGSELPLSVKSQMAVLRAWSGPLLNAPVFVPEAMKPPRRYFARLGNRHYPHMKMVVEISPDGSRWLFKADAHDRHICPLEKTPEYPAFRKLMDDNQKVVDQIETGWSAQGLPTFKSFLREDLARRTGTGLAG